MNGGNRGKLREVRRQSTRANLFSAQQLALLEKRGVVGAVNLGGVTLERGTVRLLLALAPICCRGRGYECI
jgi:hypothetical protein